VDPVQDRQVNAQAQVDAPAIASSSTTAFVRIDGVSKKFGDFVAVDNVSLEVSQGEIFCLLGGSGSGKTTLLRMLAGFETPSSGRIFIDGQDMSTIPPYERRINMMFQSYALFPHMTVEKNVAFGLEQEKLGKEEIRSRVHEILDIVQMTTFVSRKPHQLSGGQRQRVALARALVKRPKLLLLDEPLAALDRKLRERTQFELLNIQKRLGVTFIVVTHDQEEAMTLSSRMGVMNHGRIVQVGTPPAIYESPANKFVADFIGSVNLFEGRVEDEAAGRVKSDELGCVVKVDRALLCARGAPVWTAVRPEKINMERDGGERGRGENTVRGVVKEIAYMGDMSIYLVEIGTGKTVRVTLPNIARDADQRITRDEAVSLSWDPSSPVVLTD
jgi:putrescine transport system ATP-binding protein